VLHVTSGDCIDVRFTNLRHNTRASFHADQLVRASDSSGINVGYGPDNTVAPGATRDYLLYADTDKVGPAAIADFGGDDTGKDGLYGAVIVAPAGSTFADPAGTPTSIGAQVVVQAPAQPAFRDLTAILADDDTEIGQSTMPYPTDVSGPALVDYRSRTTLFLAHAGDPTAFRVLVAPGSEQLHSFSLGGQSWRIDNAIHGSQLVQTRGLAPWEAFDAVVSGGAGGSAGAPGDYFVGDLRRPFTEAGMWALLRVVPR
jgi:hypothetical protein